MLFEVKILPLIIGAVFNMILGAMWYSPVLFAKPWMKEAGITEDYVKVSQGKMGKVYVLTTVFAVITSYVIGLIITNMQIESIFTGILVAFFVWIAFSFPMVVKNWGFEDRSIKLGIINHGYDLVVYIVVSALFVVL